MNPAARWSRVSSILSSALDLPDPQRGTFLADAIAREPTLRTEILALFEEMHLTGGFLEEPAAPPDAGPSDREGFFGPYRVVGKLGEGGMGVVHLAERSDGQFTRRVAIKRIGSTAPRADVLRRFRDERQILARLDHPNIARLLDAGVDAGGVPYLVMDHVEGVPLTSFCREGNLTVGQRLSLFLKVCAAVQHAHQNLVIHRDIKPGNILVTSDGDPKLLDFGIAKVVGETLGGDATETMNRALTLDYASPEQVRGDAVTTASDVYSLGVVVYELLADRKPYEVAAMGLSEAVEMVCQTNPPPASQVAREDRRGELAGDLDSILRKAMEKAPADRYGSVAELAADVAAHLDHLPVKARRPSFGYVARKFVRRHRAGVGVAAALVVLLIGGSAAVLWQARVAERERARAQQRFEQVRQLANYVIYDLQDGIATLAGSTELRRKMVERSLQYLDSLVSEAAGDVRLQKELSGAYVRLGDVLGRQDMANLGDRPAAIAAYDKAEQLLRQVIARDAGDADARRRLARLLLEGRMVYVAIQPAERDRALKRLEESTAIWQELLRDKPGDPENLRGLALADHNASYLLRSDREKTLPRLERALQILQKLLDADPQSLTLKDEVAESHRLLTGVFARTDPARADQHALTAARLDAERVAAEPRNVDSQLDYTRDLEVLANSQLARGQYDEALRYFEQALPLRRALWEADRANTLTWHQLVFTLMRVGETHVLAGQHGRAGGFLRESIQQIEARPDLKEHWVVPTLARAYVALGEAEFVGKRSPCRSYRRFEELLRDLPDADKYLPQDTSGLRERARQRLKSCPS